MIELRNVAFSYPSGEFHLEIPRLTVGAGEKMAVIGPSGSGKTTLLNLAAGILVPSSGMIEIDKVKLEELNDGQRRDFRIRSIGFVFQDFGLIDYLDARDNILHPYRISSALTLTRRTREKAEELAYQLGVGTRLTYHPPQLSQGERQRVAICRALLPGPKLLLADEATGNLDPDNKLLILEALFEAVSACNTTLLAVTHDYELLSRFDRVTDFRTFLGMPEEAA
jgi:putative ABC transport system ATP-binding protein